MKVLVRWVAFAAACALAASGSRVAAQIGADFNSARNVRECDAVVDRYGREVLAYGCYLSLARRTGDYDAVQRHLEAHLVVQPEDHAARMNLGRLFADRSDPTALEHYEKALAGFLSEEHHEGSVYTLFMLAFYAQVYNDYPLAESRLVEADEAAAASGDRSLEARVKQRRARLAIAQNEYGRAYILAKEAEQLAFPDGTLDARVAVLGLLGSISDALERPDLALDYFRRESELIGDGTIQWLATIHANIADLARRVHVPRRYTKEERIAFAERAVDTAVRAGSDKTEARARVILGQLLDGPEAMDQYKLARELSRASYDRLGTASALWGVAWETYRANPEELPLALRILVEAEKISRLVGGVQHVARTAVLRADLEWLAGEIDAATADSFAALDKIERFRDLQRDETVRARSFGAFADAYARFAERMFSEGDLASAFLVGERMRSRVLLDRLDEIRVTGSIAEDSPSRDERDGVLERIAAVQRRLLDSGLEQGERDDLLAELEGLEVEETALRDAIGREDARFAALRRPEFPTMEEARQSLGDDEALLVFHFARDPAPETRSWRGESRLLVITSGDAWAGETAAGEDLGTRVDAFNELLQKRSGAEARAATSLFADLLEQPLRALPASVRRLIVIPDGPVFKLPIGALRVSPEAAPLAARFEFVAAPSVTLWMRWRQALPEPAEFPALVFADPELPSRGAVTEFRAAGVFGTRVELGPLPQARREGRSVVRHLGGASRLLIGGEASETTLKALPVGDYRLLHFAAHAIVDDEYPERSAVVLAAGGDSEDGLLQPREIAGLDLSGAVVVLSTCRSAGGDLLPGEGVLGLARAFFQGGAHAVVGSLWPLRDDEAAELVDGISRRLKTGTTLGSAVAATQREWIRSGRPTAAWAGLVVLGDGAVVPLPGGSRGLPAWWPLPAAAVLVALAWTFHRFRVRRRP